MPDITGTSVGETLNGTSGDDNIYGLGGNDTIFGGDGDDLLDGGEGDDFLEGQAGFDLLFGGIGNDRLNSRDGGGDQLFGGAGADTLYVSNDRAIIYGDGGNEAADDGNDLITVQGGKTTSYISAGGGDDTVNAFGSGAITIYGGSGNDAVTVSGFSNGSIFLDAGDDFLKLPGGSFTITTGAGRDTIQLTAPLLGQIRINDFTAGDSGDRLDLSIYGADPFKSGALSIFSVRNAGEGEVVKIVDPSTGASIFLVGANINELSPQNLGADNPYYTPSGETYSLPIDSPGGELIGGDGDDTLNGSNGNDALYGANGNDRIFGRDGNDLLFGGRGEDLLDGGAGMDTASYAGDFGSVFVNLTLGRGYTNFAFGDTYVSVENVIGTSFDDFIIGDMGVNRLDGAAGNDTIIGANGADVLIGGDGIDLLSFEDNSGVVFVNLKTGQGFNNAAQGDTFAGFENIVGGLFDDTLIGDDMANRLDGALGADTLVGNGGADTFVFAHAPGAVSSFAHPNASANVDTIFDFVSGEDRLEISASAFGGGLSAGPLAAGAFVIGSAATDADDRFVYDQANGKLHYDGDGNGAGAQVLFAILPNHDAIVASDVVIV